MCTALEEKVKMGLPAAIKQMSGKAFALAIVLLLAGIVLCEPLIVKFLQPS
jgi:hypothetical protein